MRPVLALARGDFRERVRRYGFLVTLGLTVWAARAALPPRGSDYVTVRIGHHRALYNSAGVGSMVALLTGVFLTLIGFYLVKGAVERDRQSGVGEILGASRLPRPTYVLAKTLSNAAVLMVIAAVMLVVAGAMQLVLGEDRHLDLVALATPFLLLTLPSMLMVAAVAVLFEMFPGLRAGLGNLAWFFLFVAFIGTGAPESRVRLPFGDLVGMQIVLPSLERACARQCPDYRAGDREVEMGISASPAARTVTPFRWSGVRWTPGAVGGRVAWGGVALALALLAARLFDRFDAARALPRHGAWWRRPGPATIAFEAPAAVEADRAPRVTPAALEVAPRSERFLPLLRAELTLLGRGAGRWWWLGALTLAVLGLTLPLAGVRAVVLPLAAIWPILLWSAMGWWERRFGADALLFSAPRPLRRQLLASWLAGVLLAVLVTGAGAVRSAVAGDAGGLAGWLAGVLFIPSFALASGVWTGSGKLFEISYLVLWYVGPLNRVPTLDYLGILPAAQDAHLAFLALGPALLALAYAGRARQLRG